MPSSPIGACPSCPTPTHGSGHRCEVYPSSSVTDAQWAVLEPLLPPAGNTAGRGGRPEKWCRRTVLDAVFYVVRGGIAWRQLPSEFPPAMTVYAIFHRWVTSGAWRRIHNCLRDMLRVADGRNPLPTAAIIDAQSIPGADTVPGASRSYDAGKKVNGRKRHIAVDTTGLLLAIVVHVANMQDADGGARVLAALRAQFSTITMVWADGGYRGRLLIWAKNVLALTVTIVKRTDDMTGFHVLPRRWVVERTFGWIVKHRRCVRDYETRPDHHENMVYIALIATMSRRLAKLA